MDLKSCWAAEIWCRETTARMTWQRECQGWTCSYWNGVQPVFAKELDSETQNDLDRSAAQAAKWLLKLNVEKWSWGKKSFLLEWQFYQSRKVDDLKITSNVEYISHWHFIVLSVSAYTGLPPAPTLTTSWFRHLEEKFRGKKL